MVEICLSLRQSVTSMREKPIATNDDAFELWSWRRLLRVPWTARQIQPVHPKGNQSWMFTGRTDAETETPILWPPDAKSWLIGKDSDAGKDWRQEEKGTTEDEMVGWHHRLDGHEFEQALGFVDGQGGLACCSAWGRKELDTTEWLNNNNNSYNMHNKWWKKNVPWEAKEVVCCSICNEWRRFHRMKSTWISLEGWGQSDPW